MMAGEDPDTVGAWGRVGVAGRERQAIGRGEVAARELRAELDRCRSLILALAEVVWTANNRGDLVGEQPSWAAYTGQTFDQYQGAGWLAAIHPEDRCREVAAWSRDVAAHGPSEFEYRVRRHDGAYRHFAVRVAPLYASDGVVRDWAGVHTDITERKLTEKSLSDGEQNLHELADAMPQIVWTSRPDGYLDYYNRRWYDFTGQPRGRKGNASWVDVVHPADLPEAQERWTSAIRSGDAYELEIRLRRSDGPYCWHLIRALPVRNDAGAIMRWYGTCTDIDELKQTEDELRASTVLLVQSNRELEDFATVASHDLQEPLRKIRAFVGCLRDEQAATLNADGRDYLDRIQNAATRMASLVSDLLEFSRISSKAKPFVPVNLNEIIAGVISDLEVRLAQTRGVVNVQVLPTVASDPTQMRQLLQNLIGNALKFHRQDEAPIVRVSAEIIDGTDGGGRTQLGASCRLSVADNGIGFEEKYLDRVFTIFQRLHGRGEYEGTGIGLAICRKIVERHGGTITARSTLGHGATFIVTMPLLQRNGEKRER
jgi:PAS domain S-box-containing protein